MNKILLFFPIISLIILSGCDLKNSNMTHRSAEKGVIDLRAWEQNGTDSIKLEGEWEFYWQQFIYPGEFKDSNKPSYISVPGTWNNFEVNGKKLSGDGFATYRLKLLLNESRHELILKTLTIQTAYRLFIDGKLVESGGLPGEDRESSIPEFNTKNVYFNPESESPELVIHVSNFDHRKGGIWGGVSLGTKSNLANEVQLVRDRSLFIIGATLVIGIYYLGLFIIRKKEKEALYFSIYCCVIALRIIVTGEITILDYFPSIPWKALIIIEYSSFFSSIPLFLLFILSMFESKSLKRVTAGTVVISSLFIFFTIAAPVRYSSLLIPVYQVITLLIGIYIIYILIKWSLNRDVLARVILTGFLLMFITVINDVLYAADIIQTFYAISYGILLFIIFQSMAMTIRFAKSFSEVERQKKQLLKTNTEYRSEIDERIRLEEELHISYQKNAKTRLAIIMGLAKLAEYRDSDTGTHIERIQEFNTVLAKQLQKHEKYKNYISDEYIEDLNISSILHDIGKVGIPDSILQKPGKLTSEEFEIMKSHPLIGGDSISTVEQKTGVRSFLTLGRDIAYMHHEKWDGSGYPQGLKGEMIPLSARLTALADVYDALTSKRCYKDAFTHEKAMNIIAESKGTHFDPDIVDAFLEIQEIFDQIRSSLQDEIASVLE